MIIHTFGLLWNVKKKGLLLGGGKNEKYKMNANII